MEQTVLLKQARNRALERDRYGARSSQALGGNPFAAVAATSIVRGAAIVTRYGSDVTPGRVPPRSKAKKVGIAAEAVDAVLELVRGVDRASPAAAIARLRQLVRRDAELRSRHAAVALAIADALIVSPTLADVQQSEALRRAALALLEPYISITDEAAVLASLSRAGLDRAPALDKGPLAAVLAD